MDGLFTVGAIQLSEETLFFRIETNQDLSKADTVFYSRDGELTSGEPVTETLLQEFLSWIKY